MDGNRDNDPIVTNPTDAEWDATLDDSAGVLRAFQCILTDAAQALVEEFRAERDRSYKRACSQRVGRPDQLATLWSPLHLRMRTRDKAGVVVSLTLSWQLVFSHGPRQLRQRKFEHIPTRNGSSDYDPFRLYQLARDHERELVVAIERRAAAIRKAWASVVSMRGAHRNLRTSRTSLTAPRSTDPS